MTGTAARRRRSVVGLGLLLLAAGALRPPAGVATLSRSEAATTAAATGGSAADYSFMYTSGDQPVRWDPCAVVHYRVNASGAPPSGGRDVAETLRRISAATGLVFVRDGRTTLLPGEDYAGWGSTDLVVAWSTATRRPALAGSVLGVGGVQAVYRGGRWQIGRAYALFDAQDLVRLRPGWGTGGVGALYAHELGHAVGLGHAASPPQVMFGRLSSSSPTVYQRGDLAGLARLGRVTSCG